jgi:parallel beta-helix repeat protein
MRTLILFIAILIAAGASATIINIPDDYTTIQAGIDAGVECDTVLVQPGGYYESINFCNKSMVLASMYLFTGNENYISSTRIIADDVSAVQIGAVDRSCMLIGFTITNDGGLGIISGASSPEFPSCPTIRKNIIRNVEPNACEAGILCFISMALVDSNSIYNVTGSYICGIKIEDSSPIISDNYISNIDYADEGAGIYCVDSSPVIRNNIITGNTAYLSGGGIHIRNSSGEIVGNLISNNDVPTGRGGGITGDCNDNLIIKGNIIRNNSSYYGGGGIMLSSSSAIISYNIIISNSASGNGGGIYMEQGNAEIINNTIYGNTSSEGGGIYIYDAGPIIKNCIFWGNEAYNNNIGGLFYNPVVTYCLVDRNGQGNINEDPLFKDAPDFDFSLQCESPCIDTGDPNSPFDPDSTRADMGALYFDQLVNINDLIKQLPKHIALSQNYPNPFNALTVIKYDLPKQSQVTIEIYDILGRKVSTLIDKQQPAGYHQAIWRADDFASGMYFYKLQAGDFNETKKMLLLK